MHVVVTKAEFARMANVTPPAVSVALKRGRVTARRDGKIDTDLKSNAAYISTSKRQRHQRSPGPGGKRGRSKAQKPSESPPGRKKVTRRERDKESVGGELQIDGETYSEAELRKMIAQANKEEQTIAIRRGELVERADVKLVFARVYTIIGSQVKTLSEKLGPDIAAALGVTEDKTQRVQELMSIDILRALNQIKKEFNTFLDSIGEAVLGAE